MSISPHIRKSIDEKIWINEKTNFHYLKRGIVRTPSGTAVIITKCNKGIETSEGSLKGTVAFGLRSIKGQMIAFSYDPDDLYLFAIEHNWTMDDQLFHQLIKDFKE